MPSNIVFTSDSALLLMDSFAVSVIEFESKMHDIWWIIDEAKGSKSTQLNRWRFILKKKKTIWVMIYLFKENHTVTAIQLEQNAPKRHLALLKKNVA